MINVNENGFVSAIDLHSKLEIGTRFDIWIKRMFEYGFAENKDYIAIVQKRTTAQGNATTYTDYLLSKDTAKEIAMIQRTVIGKQIREYLISLDNQKQDGLLLSHSDITELVNLINACYEEKIRKLARSKHLEAYLPNNPQGYHYANANTQRNKVCGIDKKDIEKRLNELNKRYDNIQQGLINVDKHDLIRIAVIDILIYFGKTKEYAINVGNLAKELSKKQNNSFTSSSDLFPLPKEYNQIYLQLNK